ncbi:MAG: DUF2505 family protein [Acidimicrobiales bacterium]|nr:DUF2505 family protein [Acidimicrobiales bacterium]
MRFEITQEYVSDSDSVEQAYAGEDLYPTLVGLPKLGGIQVLERVESGATVNLRIRFRFTGHLAGAVTAVVDPDKLTWVQETRHEIGSGHASFVLRPDHYPDRLRASGSFQIEANSHGCRRVVAGEIKVRAPLFAGRVEEAIVSGLREYLEAEAPAVDAWLID